jgi:hypothetical protein
MFDIVYANAKALDEELPVASRSIPSVNTARFAGVNAEQQACC